MMGRLIFKIKTSLKSRIPNLKGEASRDCASRSQRGIALLLVLSTLMLLSALVIEFAYDANVTYNISMNERDRLQAYYLARSAINFSKIIIKYNKEAQQMAADASKKLGKPINFQPLYKMIPVNSGILRTLMQGGSPDSLDGSSATSTSNGDSTKSPDDDNAKKLESAQQTISTLDASKAESFLSFEGDFNADVEAQDGKLSLNSFFTLNPTQPEYDRLKNILIFLMMQKPFEGLLKDQVKESQDMTTKIADFIDKNDAVNEIGGGERGPEASSYTGTNIKPKNAKLLTVEELMLVPGMTDDLLTELKKHVTVYKNTDKINPCLASDELVRAMIVAFTQKRDDVEPLRPDNEERLKQAVDQVKGKCPDTQAMSQALNDALGITGGGAAGSASTPTSNPASQPAGGTASSSSSSNSFSSWINNDEKIFKIESTGTVGNAEVKVIDVINASDSNPDKWKDLYWRVE